MRLNEINNEVMRKAFNICLSKVTLAINVASAATIKTTGTTTYLNGGLALTKAALSAQALAAHAATQLRNTGQETFYVQPASTTVYYVVCFDSSGNVYTIQGTYTGQALQPHVARKGDSSLPSDIGDFTPIGIIKVVTNGSTTFTPATTALDAAGLTVTYTDVGQVPYAAP